MHGIFPGRPKRNIGGNQSKFLGHERFEGKTGDPQVFENLIFHKIHIFKVAFLTKFTFSKSHFSQNSHCQSLILNKIHNFKDSFFTKFTFFKPQIYFSMNFESKLYIFRWCTMAVWQTPILAHGLSHSLGQKGNAQPLYPQNDPRILPSSTFTLCPRVPNSHPPKSAHFDANPHSLYGTVPFWYRLGFSLF